MDHTHYKAPGFQSLSFLSFSFLFHFFAPDSLVEAFLLSLPKKE